MLLAIKLLVVLGVLSYALAAVLGERELVVYGHGALPGAAAAASVAAFQQPLSHFVRGPRHGPFQQPGAGGGAAGQGSGGHPSGQPGEELLARRTFRTESTLYSKRQGPLLQRSLRHRPPALEGGQSDGKVITTVDGLRVKHGPGSFWGDLNHVETRLVYHQLLPRHLLQDAHAHADRIPVEDLARLASMARHAARLYARERSSLPLRVLAGLYDGFRHLHAFGRWSWTGMSYDEVWAKYEAKVKEELRAQGKVVVDDHHPSSGQATAVVSRSSNSRRNPFAAVAGSKARAAAAADGSNSGSGSDGTITRRELNRLVALRILEKSCETNPGFDRFAQVERAKAALLAQAEAAEAAAEAQARLNGKGGGLPSLTASASTSSESAAATAESASASAADPVDAVRSALWASKASPLLPLLLDHFARLAKGTGAVL